MTTIDSALRAAFVSLTLAATPQFVCAAGLGPIKVYSGLGQNLRAEIEVSATPAELQSLSARIASLDAFRQAGVPYSATAARIDVRLDPDPQRPLLRLSSSRPIDDPYVGLLVEIDWAAGNLAREYTFLLDPVELAPEAAPMPPPALPINAASPAVRTAPASPSLAERAAATPRTHLVRRGDTLHRIASANLPRGVTLDQMLIALHRANRTAFEADNINLLNAGALLALPDAAEVRAIDAGEARRVVRAQAADFQAYRRSLAAAAGREPVRAPAASQQSSGRIMPRVEEAAPAAETADRVQVSRSREALPAQADARLQALEEELAARERALDDSNERLGHLEQAVRDLQKLLELRGALTGLPAQPVAEPAALEPAVAGEAAIPAAAQAPATETITNPSAPAESSASEPEPAPDSESERSAAAQGMLQKLLEQPLLAAGLGGIAALLLLGVGFLLGRAGRGTEAVAASAASSADEQQTVFAHSAAADEHTDDSLLAGASQVGMSAIDDDGVDPVAEAEVYMAYGRDVQAEEILRDALTVAPSRAAIYLKLLEIHAQRGEVAPFEQVARPLHELSGGAGWDWEKAAAMGRKLDPGNPLYAVHNGDGETLAPHTVVPTAVAAAVATTPLAAEAAAREELVHTLSDLDFTSSRLDRPALDAVADVPVTGAEVLDFDIDEIDLDLGGDEDLAAAEAQGEVAAAGLAGGGDVDLALDFDADDAAAQPAAAEATPPQAASELSRAAAELHFDLPELELDSEPDEFDLSATLVGAAPQSGGKAGAPTAAEAEAQLATPAAAAESLDFEPGAAAPLTMAGAATADSSAGLAKPALAGGVDLSGITLELDTVDQAQANAVIGAAADRSASAMESTTIEPIGQTMRNAADAFDDSRAEIDTRLELARAYEDMGDREGALELIEEVLRDGSAAQQLAAQEIRQRLG